jgi:maltooligosyltrehalose trehalohydrolase
MFGAKFLDDFGKKGVEFKVYAPDINTLEVVVFSQTESGLQETAAHALEKDSDGYFGGFVEGLPTGTRYMYRLDGDKTRPDYASRSQPDGVHGASEVRGSTFLWHDSDWCGMALEDMVIYETHVGTATPEGTFEALIEKLDYLKDLGVTTIEIMPVADFPGDRNWGYDGVYLYAPARAYGEYDSFKRLVDAAHAKGLAVLLDVVYNHFGPDGNYIWDYARNFFTSEKKTPWGDAINFALPPVREFFIQNALYWAHEFHVDGFRLDATHAILDDSSPHFLQELAQHVRDSLPAKRQFVLFAEDERNDVKLLQAPPQGYGLDGVWADDFHHQLRAAFAGDHEGYYADFTGSTTDIATTLLQGWFYTGQISKFSGQARGTDARAFDPARFVYCIQNHDQIGNRAIGDRLNHQISPEAYKAASGLLLLSPYTPLLFQGQEWAATSPYQFFTDHEPNLGKMVTEGRRKEFSAFAAFNHVEIPDPQAVSTFENSKLRWGELDKPEHAGVLALYRDLLQVRRTLHNRQRARDCKAFQAGVINGGEVIIRYSCPPDAAFAGQELLVVTNLLGDLNLTLDAAELTRPPVGKRWELLLATNDPRYGGGEPEFERLKLSVGNGHLAYNGSVTVVLRCQAV